LLDALAESERGNFARAEKAMATAHQLSPEYYEVYRVEAAVQAREKNYPAAISSYEAALELEPSSAKVRYAFGYFQLISLNDPEAALVQFREGLKIEPDNIDLCLDCVRALLYSKQFEEARGAIDRLLKKAPTFRSFTHRIKLADLNLQYFLRKADSEAVFGGVLHTILADLETLLSEFKRVPREWVDDRMKLRLTKAIPIARKCVREIGTNDEHARAENILQQLYELQPEASTLFPKGVRQGSVVRFFPSKGFGFISTDDGKELFFGLDAMRTKSEWKSVVQGIQVEYQLGKNKKGPCAVGVRIRKIVPGIVSPSAI
jgi:tetratricopeptide (TPR) repeat protein